MTSPALQAFSFDREVRFGDCDPSGIAYFPSYLNILNGVVEEFWAQIGFPWQTLITERRLGTPTVHLDCDFVRPSQFGDPLSFRLNVQRIGQSSLDFQHLVHGDDGPRWTARQTVVAMSIDSRRSLMWPHDIREALVQCLSSTNCAAEVSFSNHSINARDTRKADS